MPLRPLVQKQFLVRIDQVKSESDRGDRNLAAVNDQFTAAGSLTMQFNKVTAPKETREQVEYEDGQTGVIRKLSGFVNTENVTLTRNYDPDSGYQLYQWYRSIQSAESNQRKTPTFTVTITPILADLAGTALRGESSGGNRSIQLINCQVVSLTLPEVDRMADGLATMELEISYDSFKIA